MKKLFTLAFVLCSCLTSGVIYAQEHNREVTFVEEEPKPKVDIVKFLTENLKYPQKAADSCIQGTVLARFVVDTLGGVDSVYILHGVHALLNKEAIRVINKLSFTPGKQNGQLVRVYMTQPIVFRLYNIGCPTEEAYYKKGEDFYNSGNMVGAAMSFQQAFRMNYKNMAAGYNCAMAYINQGRKDAACVFIDELLAMGYEPANALSAYCRNGQAAIVADPLEIPTFVEENPEIYTYLEEPAKPRNNLKQFLAEHLHYPEEAKKQNIEGKVIVRLIINESGKIDSAYVIKGVHTLLDQEAIRVVNLIDFFPGKQGGKPVKSYYTMPVPFKKD